MIKKTIIAALAASGLAGISTVQASTTDLLLGFNDAAGPGGAQNDYVIDLGVSGSTLVADANGNGGTYDLSSLLIPGTFSTAFSADSSALNDVSVGVVGSITGLTPSYLFQTLVTGSTPGTVFAGQVKNAEASASTSTVGEYASGSTTGWSYNVAASATAPGNASLITGNDVADQTGNPLGLLSSGVASLDLWEISKTGVNSVSSWVDEGTFNINLNSDSVTFTALAAPEPTTSALLGGGAGLLLISLRHKLTRKTA